MTHVLVNGLPVRLAPQAPASPFGWLDKHSGAVSATSTIVLVVITGVYVVLTYLSVRGQRAQLLAQTMPSLATVIATPEGSDPAAPADKTVFYVKTRLLSGSPADGVTLERRLGLGDGKIEIEHLGYALSLGQGEVHRWRAEVTDPADEHALALVLSYADPAWTIFRMDLLVLVHRDPTDRPVHASQSWRGDRRTVIYYAAKGLSLPRRVCRRAVYRGKNLGEITQTPEFREAIDAEFGQLVNRMLHALETFGATSA